MDLKIELSVNEYYQLCDACRAFPSYAILKRAIFRENTAGIGDRFAIHCTLREAGELLDVARRHSLTAAVPIEKTIRTSPI
jgi:hypothetical protein